MDDAPDTTGQLPVPEPWVHADAKPFWGATAEGRLSLPRCASCGTVIWHPRGFCPTVSAATGPVRGS